MRNAEGGPDASSAAQEGQPAAQETAKMVQIIRKTMILKQRWRRTSCEHDRGDLPRGSAKMMHNHQKTMVLK